MTRAGFPGAHWEPTALLLGDAVHQRSFGPGTLSASSRLEKSREPHIRFSGTGGSWIASTPAAILPAKPVTSFASELRGPNSDNLYAALVVELGWRPLSSGRRLSDRMRARVDELPRRQ